MIESFYAASRQAYANDKTPVRWRVGRMAFRQLVRESRPGTWPPSGFYPHVYPPHDVVILGLPATITDEPVGFGLVVR